MKTVDEILHYHIRKLYNNVSQLEGFDEMKFNAKFKKFLMVEDFITKKE